MSNLHTPTQTPIPAALLARCSQQPLRFDEYMDLALYDPEYGYYMAKQNRFGHTGDFITAPTLTPLFGRALGHWCAHTSKHALGCDEWVLMEWGGGHGDALCQILTTLQAKKALPQEIICIEISPYHQEIMRGKIAQHCPAALERVNWTESLPHCSKPCLLIANELLDALPTSLFTLTEDGIAEKAVIAKNGQLTWTTLPARPEIIEHVHRLERQNAFTFPVGYTSEITLAMKPLIAELALLPHLCALFIDYGYPQSEFYLPDRYMGTLMCHTQQRAHADPLLAPGYHDITAHVDFSYAAQLAQQAQLDVLGFTNQTAFLLDCGLLEEIENNQDQPAQIETAAALKQLLLANHMGEAFKVLALAKNCPAQVSGFSLKDYRERL